MENKSHVRRLEVGFFKTPWCLHDYNDWTYRYSRKYNNLIAIKYGPYFYILGFCI